MILLITNFKSVIAMRKTLPLIILLSTVPLLTQAQQNFYLLNIVEVQPTVEVQVQGEAAPVTINRDEVKGWLEAAMDSSAFGGAQWTGVSREDSVAFLHLGLYLNPQPDGSVLATALFRVYRPGMVLDIPPAQSFLDVTVMENTFSYLGSETFIRRQTQALIGQFVGYVSDRIRSHNPE